jgi:peptide/nickel transport system permease protein
VLPVEDVDVLTTTEPEDIAPVHGGTAATPASVRRRKKGTLGIGGWLCTAWLAVVVGTAVLAPLLPIKEPNEIDFTLLPHEAPSGHALLGTDEQGRDILARLIWGGRVSLVVALGVILIGMVVGGLIGLISGYFGGKVDTFLMSIVDILLAFPALILLIALTAYLGGPGLRNVVLGISLVSIPAFARISRATTLAFAQREFVLAARTAGATNWRIIRREILPNVMFPVVAFALLVVAIAIVAEGSLAFLGLSVPKPDPSWGSMIDGGRSVLTQRGILHVSLFPAIMMFLTVLSVNFLGDRFRARFDVREAAV